MKKSTLLASLGIAGLMAVGCASNKAEEKPADTGDAKPAEGSCGGEHKGGGEGSCGGEKGGGGEAGGTQR
jgi:hypothetical protein